MAPDASAFGKVSIRCSSDQIIMLETQKGKRAVKWLYLESMEKLAYRGAITTMWRAIPINKRRTILLL